MRIGLGIGIPQFQGNGPSGIASSINFAQLVTGDVPSGWTFTRSTSGTYFDASGVLQLASTNVLRISRDPVSGELGYLAEPGRTNLCLQSANLGTSWSRTRVLAFGSGSALDAITAPDGTLTGDLITEDTTASDTHYVRQAITVVSGTTYTASVYVRAGTRTFVTVSESSSTARCATFNLSTGQVSSIGSGLVTAGSEVCGSWVRCWIVYVPGTTTFNLDISIRTQAGAGAEVYTGDGTSGLYVWGAQLEAGSYPTSYIPTTTVAVSRGADLLTTTLSAAHAAALSVAGTMVARFSFLGGGSAVDPGVRIICAVDDGTATNRNIIYNSAAGYVAGLCGESGGSSAGPVVSSSKPTNTPVKAAIGWGLNDVNIGVDGSLGTKDASFTPGTVTKLAVGGASYTGFFGPSCLIHSLAVHTSHLTDAQLQALTA